MKYYRLLTVVVILLAIFNLAFIGLYLQADNRLERIMSHPIAFSSATSNGMQDSTYIFLTDEQINKMIGIDPDVRIQPDLSKSYILKVSSILNFDQQNLWLRDHFKNVYDIHIDIETIAAVRAEDNY